MELFLLLSLGCAVTLALAVASLSGRSGVQRRLARLAGQTAAAEPAPAGSVYSDDAQRWWMRVLRPFASRALRDDEGAFRRVRERVLQAGYRRSSAVVVFVGSRVLLAVVLPAALLAFPPVWTLPPLRLAALLLAAVGVGFVAPAIWVDRRRNARRQKLLEGLPDALDLILVCVEAGLGVQAALARVAREFALTNPTLSEEFELVLLEIAAGKSSAEALRSLARRSGLTEMSSLAAMLIQTERFGTSIADTLRVHADAMRVRRIQRAEELAAKAPVKMLFPTLLIFLATLFITIGPGILQLFQFFSERTP